IQRSEHFALIRPSAARAILVPFVLCQPVYWIYRTKSLLHPAQAPHELGFRFLIVEIEHVALLNRLAPDRMAGADASRLLLRDVALTNPAGAFVIEDNALLDPAGDDLRGIFGQILANRFGVALPIARYLRI